MEVHRRVYRFIWILFSDFELEALSKVFGLLHTGSTAICRQNLQSLKEIVDCLKISTVNTYFIVVHLQYYTMLFWKPDASGF